MKPRIAHSLVAAFATLQLCSSSLGQKFDKAAPDQLRAELIQRLKALELSYDNVQGKSFLQTTVDYDKAKQQRKQRGEDVSKVTEEGLKVTQDWEISFAVAGRYRQCDLKSPSEAVAVVASSSSKSKEPARLVYCMGPRGSFAIKWPTLESSAEIKSFTTENSDPNSRYSNYLGVYFQSPYALPFGRLVELLQDPNFKIDRIEMISVDGHDCLRVFFEKVSLPRTTTEKPKSKHSRLVGSFVTDPSLGYALRSFEYGSADKPWMTVATNVEYQPLLAPEDLPLPKKVENLGFGSVRNVMIFKELARTNVPDSRFTLTAYGLPEMDRPVGDQNRNTMAYWLGGVAVALLALASWLWNRSRAVVA